MVTNISYNVMIDRLRAFADGHYLIKKFSHGQIDLRYLEQDADYYPWMHVIPGTITPREGLREYSFDITFSDLTRDKEHEAEYIREAISDCTRLAEDLLAEIKNGNTLFDPLVQSVDGSTITPFIHEDTHTLTGVTLSLSIRVPWNWSACDIPADYAPGGSGSGGSGEGGCCVTLQVEGTDNVDQTLLNLVAGTNMTITDNGDGSVTFDSTGGGGGGGELVALEWSADHVSATGNEYEIGDFVWYNGNVYECIATNDSIIPTNTSYWTLVGAGNRLREQPTDWNATSGDNQILNKPTFAAVATSGDYTDLINTPSIPSVLNDLTDVTIATPLGYNVLRYDSITQQWINDTPQSIAGKIDINDLDDVDIVTPTNGQVLTYDSVTQSWENATPSTSPTGNAGGDLSGTYPNPTVHRIHGVDMQSGTPTDGDTWVYSNTNSKWQHQMLHASQVDNDSAVTGQHVDDALDHLNTTKIDANAPITAATKTKITYDADGLVTAGADLAASDMPSGIDATKIGAGTVSDTEFGYLDGVTSAIQTQLNNKKDSLAYGNVYATTVGASSTVFAAISGLTTFNATESNRHFAVPVAGIVKNFYVKMSGTQSATGSLVITIRNNATSSAVTVTVTNGDGASPTKSDNTNTLTVAAGDLLAIQLINNATATSASVVSMSFVIERT